MTFVIPALCCVLLNTHDLHTEPLFYNRQTFEMEKFICLDEYDPIGPVTYLTVCYAHNRLPVCEWPGVQCNAQEVVEKLLFNIPLGSHFALEWAPHTVRSLTITLGSARKDFAFHTRLLPKELRFCMIHNCALSGEFEMRTLPENLVSISVRKNRLRGIVCLVDIPAALRTVDLRNNLIDKLIWEVQAMNHLDYIQVSHWVKSVEVVCVDNDKTSNKIILK